MWKRERARARPLSSEMKQDGGEELRERERERTKLFLVLVSFSLLLFFPFDAILLIYIDGGR